MSGRAATINVVPGLHALSVGRTEMPAPRGWTWVPLEEVARLESGHTPSREHPEYWDGGIPWIGIKDARAHHAGVISQTLQTVTQAGIDNSAARVLPTGTVCLSRTASVGYVVVTGRAMATSQDFVNWICGPALDPHFLKYLFIAENESLHRFSKGTTHSTIYYPEVKAFHVCVPPLAEQKRIVAKLEELTARSRRAKEALDAVPPLLDQLRQSILAAACSGALTRGTSQSHQGGAKRWRLVPLEDLVVPGGIFDGARDHGAGTNVEQNLRSVDYTTSGVRVIRLENLAQLAFNSEKKVFISESKYEGLKQATVSEGDIMFGSFIEERLRVCLLPALDTPALVKADCFCIRPRPELVNREYLALQLACERTRRDLRELVHGATRPRITTKQLRRIAVPICSMEEQAEIVTKARSLLSRIEEFRCRVDDSEALLDALLSSILCEAFRGNLVSQDPSEEPARAALALIATNGPQPVSRGGGFARRSTAIMRREAEPANSREEPHETRGLTRPQKQTILFGLDSDILHDEVFTGLWTLGVIEAQQAALRVAEHLRDIGRIQVDRLDSSTPLHAEILAAIDSAVAANHLDRPLPNHVRAIKPDPTSYTPDDWQHILLTTLPTTRTDRETAIRTAAEYARDNLGLRFSRLRSDGHIVQALRSAITTAIRRGDVLRHGSTQISRATRGT